MLKFGIAVYLQIFRNLLVLCSWSCCSVSLNNQLVIHMQLRPFGLVQDHLCLEAFCRDEISIAVIVCPLLVCREIFITATAFLAHLSQRLTVVHRIHRLPASGIGLLSTILKEI